MSFTPAELTRDGFLDGRLKLWQPRQGYRAAIDPLFLAAFVPAMAGERVLDLGCGAGTAGLCLARRVGGIDLHGLEVQPDYADLARRNAEAAGLPMVVHDGDLRFPPIELRRLTFDHVLANPPFSPLTDPKADNVGRDRAHREIDASLTDWIVAGLRRLKPRGTLVLIHRTERLATLLAGLEGPAGAIEIVPLVSRQGRPASRVLVRARKGSRKSLRLFSALTVHRGSTHISHQTDYTDEATKILREMRELLPDARLGGRED